MNLKNDSKPFLFWVIGLLNTSISCLKLFNAAESNLRKYTFNKWIFQLQNSLVQLSSFKKIASYLQRICPLLVMTSWKTVTLTGHWFITEIMLKWLSKVLSVVQLLFGLYLFILVGLWQNLCLFHSSTKQGRFLFKKTSGGPGWVWIHAWPAVLGSQARPTTPHCSQLFWIKNN